MYLALLGLAGWGYLLTKAQLNRRKRKICKVPHNIRGCGGDDEEEQPQITYSQAPEYQAKMDLFNRIQKPYMESQYKQYTDIFEPQSRALGGILGEQLKQSMSLPEDIWNNIWQKSREKTSGEYEKAYQTGSERLAGKGMLGSGVAEKYFQGLDLSKAKSMEDIAVDMAIAEWQDKVKAKQQSISNMQSYLGYQPTFNLDMPTSTATTSLPEEDGNWYDWMAPVGTLASGTGSLFSNLFNN